MSNKSSCLLIGVDSRIELMTVIQSFVAKYDGMLTRYDVAYKREVQNFFSDHRNHGAIELFRRAVADSIQSDAYPILMLHLSDPPELRMVSEPPDSVAAALMGRPQMRQFTELLSDFVSDSGFLTFWERKIKFISE